MRKQPSYGETVRARRKAAGLTQVELGKLAKLPRGPVEISEVERGKNQKAYAVWAAIDRALRKFS